MKKIIYLILIISSFLLLFLTFRSRCPSFNTIENTALTKSKTITGTCNLHNIQANNFDITIHGVGKLSDLSEVNRLIINGTAQIDRLQANTVLMNGMSTITNVQALTAQFNGPTTIKDSSFKRLRIYGKSLFQNVSAQAVEILGYLKATSLKTNLLHIKGNKAALNHSEINTITISDNKIDKKAKLILKDSAIKGTISFQTKQPGLVITIGSTELKSEQIVNGKIKKAS